MCCSFFIVIIQNMQIKLNNTGAGTVVTAKKWYYFNKGYLPSTRRCRTQKKHGNSDRPYDKGKAPRIASPNSSIDLESSSHNAACTAPQARCGGRLQLRPSAGESLIQSKYLERPAAGKIFTGATATRSRCCGLYFHTHLKHSYVWNSATASISQRGRE